MVLQREQFENVKEIIKSEICCMIPTNITEIATDAFLDWECLQYVYIPNCVTKIDSNAFNWETIKYLFLEENDTICLNTPSHIKILPTSGNEKVLFEILDETMKFKRDLEFDPDIIERTNQKLKIFVEKFQKETSEKVKKIEEGKQELQIMLEQLEQLNSKNHTLSAILQEQINKVTTENLENAINSNQSRIDQTYENIKKELKKFKDIIKNSENIKQTLEIANKEIEQKINEITTESIKKLKETYENNENEIIEQTIEKATEQLIQKNPCRTIIINIPDLEQKKLQMTDLFHKDFDKVLKLVLTKKPILLKGPAGSGKNVIIEQIARILNLQFRYINDVTDEFKVTGFVDANGNYIKTQFFRGFTEGGLMFIDEIDNSSPSALLSINSAIGTGKNHYMSFPDGNFYKAHEDFYLVAAANTFGTGADMIYTGRQNLDGASLNRFVPISIDYDQNIESQLIQHEDILPLFWEIRKIINENTIKHVISTRNIINANDFLNANFELEDIFDWTIIQGLDTNDLNIICSRITTRNRFATKFLDHAKRKYKVSERL